MTSQATPWLPDLPATWERAQIRRVAEIRNGADYKEVEVAEGGYPVYGSGGEFRRAGKYLFAGESVLFGRKGTIDKPLHVTGRFWTVDTMFYTDLNREKVVPRYLYYYATTMPFGLYATSTALPSVTGAQLAGHTMPLPPLEVQKVIADYLDRETARIDTLIEEQRRLIELLQGRRKAVVERAVFGGLDDAPTRQNAEPWLPATPEHWPIVQLGFLSDTLAGYAFLSDGFSADESHGPLLRGVNVKPGAVDWSEVVYWDAAARPVPPEYSLQVGDLVFGMDRPFVGAGVRIAPVTEDDLPALLVQRVMRIRSIEGIDSSYLRYAVATDAFLDYLEPLFTGVSVPHVSEWQVRKFKMPCPPLDEQQRIVEYLDAQTAKSDELIAETERFIELSRERRAALITAAVTGQIDVREVA